MFAQSGSSFCSSTLSYSCKCECVWHTVHTVCKSFMIRNTFMFVYLLSQKCSKQCEFERGIGLFWIGSCHYQHVYLVALFDTLHFTLCIFLFTDSVGVLKIIYSECGVYCFKLIFAWSCVNVENGLFIYVFNSTRHRSAIRFFFLCSFSLDPNFSCWKCLRT